MNCQLEGRLVQDRIDEMDRFGRSHIYHRMRCLLEGERRDALDLVNHGLAMVDDVLDSVSNPLEYLGQIQDILKQSFSGATIETSTPEKQAVADLGSVLSKLTSARFPNLADRAIGKHTYLEVLNYWKAEAENLQRRGQILDSEALNKLTTDVGSLVASQFLFILDYPSDPYAFIQLAKTYGLAVKLADNLCDFRKDIQKGFVNIPREEIHHVGGIKVIGNKVTQIEPDKLTLDAEYMRCEYERVQQMFKSAERLLLKAGLRHPVWDKKSAGRLDLFNQFCRTWLNQTSEFVITETARI